MKNVVQMVSCQTGARSEEFIVEPKEFAELLRKNEVPETDYILVVAVVGEENQLEICKTPLFTVESFLKNFYPEDYMEDSDDAGDNVQATA